MILRERGYGAPRFLESTWKGDKRQIDRNGNGNTGTEVKDDMNRRMSNPASWREVKRASWRNRWPRRFIKRWRLFRKVSGSREKVFC